MKQYRTQEQFEEIAANCINGNWTDAGKNCVEYGFYANDLIKANEETNLFNELTDIAVLVEIAMEQRGK